MNMFLAKKDRGFFCTAAAVLCTLLGLVFFLLLASASPEESEDPTLIVVLACAALLLHLVTAFKDYFKLPSMAAYASSTALLLLFLGGRASYLAFYFSGVVLDTGLSPFMVLAALCFLVGVIAALLAVVFRQEKAGIPGFRTEDLKTLLPIAAVAVVLCVGTVALQGGSSTLSGPSGPDVSLSLGSDSVIDQSGAAYKTPTTAEAVWQEYDGAAFQSEDLSAKAIAYQLSGHSQLTPGGDPMDFDVLLNLYEDGLSVLTVYGMGRASTYYGYWTDVNDENLWFCVAHYAMESQAGTRTIDYSYELTGHFDEITVNIALGFADGGQFIRELPIGGSGMVLYSSAEDFLTEKGWTAPAGSEPEPSEADAPEQNDVLFSWTSDSENFLLDCSRDGTYTFTFVTAGLVETGEWSWTNWTFTLTDANGKVTTAAMDQESHELSLHFEAAATAAVNRDFVCDAVTWGTALGTIGNYTVE